MEVSKRLINIQRYQKYNMEKLIEGCIKGNPKARREIFRRYRSVLLGICLRYSRDKSEAEDVLLEGFMQIYQKIGSYAGKGSFEGWMKTVMVHAAINYFRKNQKENFHENIEDYSEIITDEINILNHLDAKEILKLIQSMPQGYRIAFNLFAIEGYSHKEIAEKLQYTESTSKSQVRKARFWLMKKIDNNFD